MAAGRAAGRAAQARQDPRRPGAPQPGAADPGGVRHSRPPGPPGIFRIQRQPVRTARSVHALADAIRRNAEGRLDAAKDLAAELDRHAATLGLNDDADRQATSRVLTALLARLAATTDDTQTVRVLAAADLPEGQRLLLRAPGQRGTADDRAAPGELAGTRRSRRRGRRRRRGRHRLGAAPGRPPRRAGDRPCRPAPQGQRRRDRPVHGAGRRSRTPASAGHRPVPPVRRSPRSRARPAAARRRSAARRSRPATRERVRARDVPAFVERICEAADENPDAEFEIAWRIVEP